MSDPTSTRSRNGCWTCKRRRRKCDETHPTCTTCRDNKLACEGYEPRLRWDVGVASRGHLTGASLPAAEHAPPRQKGRQRDILKQEKTRVAASGTTKASITDDAFRNSSSPASVSTQSNSGSTPDLVLDSLSLRDMQKETLFQDFLTSGIKLLHSTDTRSNPLLPTITSLCESSEIFRDVCIACQAYLSYGANYLFYELYSEALSKFRASIDHPLMKTDAAVVNAALMLCTIGILQGTPWTIHIRGMEKLLDERASLSPLADPEPVLTQAIEIMGIFDLPNLVIGRQTPSLHIWRRYRLGQLVRVVPEADHVEAVTGIPRSMIDILAYEGDDLMEEDLWLWTGCVGTLLQCQLWDAYRYSTMLNVRRKRQRRSATIHQTSVPELKTRLPADEILLIKALSAIDAVYNGAMQPAAIDSLVLSAILYPLFLVGVEVFMSRDKEKQEVVTEWYKQRLREDPFANARQSWEVLQTISSTYEEGRYITADEVARSQGIEVALT